MDHPASFSDLPFADLLQPHGDDAPRSGERYDTVHFDGTAFRAAEALGARFLECALTDCAFTDGTLRGSGLMEVYVSGTRFVGTSLAETDWQDATADSCVLAGVEAFGARVRRTVFRRCKFDSVNLRAAVLRDVVFEDCVLRDADFGGAKLTDVSFPGTALHRVRLGGSTLTHVDLRGASVLDLADGHEALRGATITPVQLLDLAPALAAAVGLHVADAGTPLPGKRRAR